MLPHHDNGLQSPRRRVRVTLLGFGRFWAPVLAEGLKSRYSDELDVRWMEWPSRWSERARFIFELLRCDVAVRVGMPLEFDSETNRLFLKVATSLSHPKVVNYWIGGGDLPVFAKRLSAGQVTERDRRALAHMTHFAAAENIAEELRALGVVATPVIFPAPERTLPATTPPLPDEFRVLTYWSDGRADVLGAAAVLAAARALPAIEFDVVGTGGATFDAPDNATFHGRVEDVGPYHLSSVVSVRLAVHDAVPGAMVLESLAYARHVVYSYEYPHTTFVEYGDVDGLTSALSSLQERHARGELSPNAEGRSYVLRRYDANLLFLRIKEALVEVSRGG